MSTQPRSPSFFAHFYARGALVHKHVGTPPAVVSHSALCPDRCSHCHGEWPFFFLRIGLRVHPGRGLRLVIFFFFFSFSIFSFFFSFFAQHSLFFFTPPHLLSLFFYLFYFLFLLQGARRSWPSCASWPWPSAGCTWGGPTPTGGACAAACAARPTASTRCSAATSAAPAPSTCGASCPRTGPRRAGTRATRGSSPTTSPSAPSTRSVGLAWRRGWGVTRLDGG